MTALDPARSLRPVTNDAGKPLAGKVPTVVTLQYMRALAAGLIVFHHSMSPPQLAPFYPHYFATAGVDLFFVISGFIMWTTTATAARGPLAFWRARIARVVPLYWVFTTLFIAVVLLASRALFNPPLLDAFSIVTSYLFVPTASPPVYSLGWTLNYEMFFYLIFGLCLAIAAKPTRLAVLTLLFAGLTAAGAIAAPHNAILAAYSNPIMLEFLAGVYIAVFAPRLLRLPAPAAGALIAAGILVIAYDAWVGPAAERIVMFGLPAALIVAGALAFEARARAKPIWLLLFLGNASYSIYLAHPFGERIWYLAENLVMPGMSTPAALALYVPAAIVAGLLAGTISYLLIEKPLLARSRRLLHTSSVRVPALPEASAAATPSVRPRLLYVVTEDWYFLSHRLPMARAAQAAGFEVHVATHVVDGQAAIEAEGFVLHPVPFVRGSLSLRASLATVFALRRIHRDIRPAVVHHVALQAVVLGSLAAIAMPAARVNAITGFGYTFATGGARARIVRRMIVSAIRLVLYRRDAVILVQSDDDRAGLEALGIAAARVFMIPGSGIEVSRLTPLPEPAGVPTVGFVGRLLGYKGIRVVAEAQVLLRTRGVNVDLLIAGTPDPTNPDSLSTDEVNAIAARPGVIWLGFVRDIATVWARAHIAVLPSRNEGIPKSLLEAAACARPMIATDIPGCRDIVRPGVSGLLVPVDDVPALAAAIETLAGDPQLRARYGAAARLLAVERFSAQTIGSQTADLYLRLLRPF